MTGIPGRRAEMSEEQELISSRSKGIKHGLAGVSLVLVVLLLFGLVTKLLWNWLMPELFGLKTISYLQALGLLLMSRVLIGRTGQRRDHAGYLTGKYGFRNMLFPKRPENGKQDV